MAALTTEVTLKRDKAFFAYHMFFDKSTGSYIADVITHAKFCDNRFRVFGVLIPPIWPFSIGIAGRPYNSVSTTGLHCDSHRRHQHATLLQGLLYFTTLACNHLHQSSSLYRQPICVIYCGIPGQVKVTSRSDCRHIYCASRPAVCPYLNACRAKGQ